MPKNKQTRFNDDPENPLIKVGDKVTTDFQPGAEDVVRTVTEIYYATFLKVWRISTDAGPICECCQRPFNSSASIINSLPDMKPGGGQRPYFRKVSK